MNIEGRCYALCKNPSHKSCFTRDQVNCIRDMVINRIGAIKTAITDTDLSTSIDKALLRKAIEELELWCREIGQ